MVDITLRTELVSNSTEIYDWLTEVPQFTYIYFKYLKEISTLKYLYLISRVKFQTTVRVCFIYFCIHFRVSWVNSKQICIITLASNVALFRQLCVVCFVGKLKQWPSNEYW